MSSEPKNIRDTFADQLAHFDDKLHATTDNVEMLAEIQQGIGGLLASSGNSEAQIRRILQERYEAGALRKETFQLVKSMLDRYVTEHLPTSSTKATKSAAAKAAKVAAAPRVVKKADGDDVFSTTDVIPSTAAPDDSADARVQVGSLLRDQYLLQEEISGGSMGVVYKALDRRLAKAGSKEQWVAIKILSPQLARNGEALRALQQEAAKVRCLVHPHIVRFIDLDREDDLYFLIMEWLEGRTLANILDSRDASIIDQDAAFRIVRQIGDALDYAHRCGIVHADIKPGNIMIMPNGDARLFDFGIARVRQKHIGHDFDPGVLGGLTAAYSSMQVLTGEDPTVADDVFSLACLLYRLVAGYRVFGPRNAADASAEGMKPQRLRALSDNQWRAMKRALSNSRVMRFKSMREFIDALDDGSDEISDGVSDEVSDEVIIEDAAETIAEEFVEDRGIGKLWLALIVVAGFAGTAAYQLGYLEPLLEQWAELKITIPNRLSAVETVVEEKTEAPQPIVAKPEVAIPAVEERVVDEVASEAEYEPEESAPHPILVDFSKLQPATIIVPFSIDGSVVEPVGVTLREDGAKVIVDFVRDGDLSSLLTLRLKEVGFSGDHSPWAAGQFAISNSGVILFPKGQAIGRVTLMMASDPLREADQQSTLRLGELGSTDSELAVLTVTLEDDDRRLFESGLPVNTVAFAVSHASVRETDSAAQIDIVRFNPDDSAITVEFAVSDISATQGEDYFAPDDRSISFAPGQKSARLLVPLVSDAEVEGDEAFAVQLIGVPDVNARNVYRRIVVTIHDSASQRP